MWKSIISGAIQHSLFEGVLTADVAKVPASCKTGTRQLNVRNLTMDGLEASGIKFSTLDVITSLRIATELERHPETKVVKLFNLTGGVGVEILSYAVREQPRLALEAIRRELPDAIECEMCGNQEIVSHGSELHFIRDFELAGNSADNRKAAVPGFCEAILSAPKNYASAPARKSAGSRDIIHVPAMGPLPAFSFTTSASCEDVFVYMIGMSGEGKSALINKLVMSLPFAAPALEPTASAELMALDSQEQAARDAVMDRAWHPDQKGEATNTVDPLVFAIPLWELVRRASPFFAVRYVLSAKKAFAVAVFLSLVCFAVAGPYLASVWSPQAVPALAALLVVLDAILAFTAVSQLKSQIIGVTIIDLMGESVYPNAENRDKRAAVAVKLISKIFVEKGRCSYPQHGIVFGSVMSFASLTNAKNAMWERGDQ